MRLIWYSNICDWCVWVPHFSVYCTILRWFCSIPRPITILVGEESKARSQWAHSPNLRKAAIIVFLQTVDQRLTLSPPIPFPQQRSGPVGDPSTPHVSLHSPKPQVGRVQISGSWNQCCLRCAISQLQAQRSHTVGRHGNPPWTPRQFPGNS